MDQYESPEARAAGIFKRMDVNSDGRVTRYFRGHWVFYTANF